MNANTPRRHFASAEAIGKVKSVQPTTVGQQATPVVRIQLDLGGEQSVTVSFWGAAGASVQNVAVGAVMRAWGRLAQWGQRPRVSIDVRADSVSGYSLLTDAVGSHCGWTIRGRLEGVATDPSQPNEALAAIAVIIPAAEREGRIYPERRTEYTVTCPAHIAAGLSALRPGTEVEIRGTIEEQLAPNGYGRVTRTTRLVATEVASPALPTAQATAPAAEQPRQQVAQPTDTKVVPLAKQQRTAAVPF
jgi:hypothetical protein